MILFCGRTNPKAEKITIYSYEEVNDIPAAIPKCPKQEVRKQLVLPAKGNQQNRLLDYLCNKRSIDTGIVSTLIEDDKIYEDRRGNVVFVGMDGTAKVRFASLRGTSDKQQFRMDCIGSDKQYGFHMTYSQSKRLYVFESPIDAMSHASIENIITNNKCAWLRDNRLSLSGTSDKALPEYLKQNPQTKEIILCLDNDSPGRNASVAIARKYADKGFHTRIELPQKKDYNEDLLFLKSKKC